MECCQVLPIGLQFTKYCKFNYMCDLNFFKRNVNSFSLYLASCGIYHLMVIWFILVLAWINVFFVNVLEQCACLDECA